MKFLSMLFFFFLLPAAILFYLPLLIIWLGYYNTFTIGWWEYLAWVCWLGGGVICIWTVADFWRKGGTPAPLYTVDELVDSGLYRYSRNPMYLGAWMIVAGYIFWAQTWAQLVYSLLVLGFFQVIIVFFEEPRLRKKYGASYEQYCQRTPRWLLRLRSTAR